MTREPFRGRAKRDSVGGTVGDETERGDLRRDEKPVTEDLPPLPILLLGHPDRVAGSKDLHPVEALDDRLTHADVAVVPGRFAVYGRLALPAKLLEYAALGIPSLVGDHEGVRRYFDESQLDFFEPEDASGLARALVASAPYGTTGNRSPAGRTPPATTSGTWPRGWTRSTMR